VLKTVSPQEAVANSLSGESSGTVSTSGTVPAKQAGTETVVPLLNTCVREQERRGVLYHRRILATIVFAFLSPMIATYQAAWLYGYSPSLTFVLVAGAFFALFQLLLLGGQALAQGRQLESVRALAKIAPDDPRARAALLDSLPLLPVRSWFTRNIEWGDYRSLFPLLASSLWHAGVDLPLTLNEQRRTRLRGTLNELWNGREDLGTDEMAFCASAIKALTLVGDRKSVTVLTRIAKTALSRIKPGSLTTGENRFFLQSLAQDCLPMLAECDAGDTDDRKGLRALLHPCLGKINTNDVDNFLNTIGEARGNRRSCTTLRNTPLRNAMTDRYIPCSLVSRSRWWCWLRYL
jgi:hypothetical protein